MFSIRQGCWFALLTTVLLSVVGPTLGADAPKFSFERGALRVTVRAGGQPIGTYVFQDATITRPFICDVRTLSGTRVTRNHPPIEGQDLTDHDTFHPGLWLAFGDLGGSDFWRLQAPVEHAGFVEEPTAIDGGARFAVKNRYRDRTGGRVICEETCRYTWTVRPEGYPLEIESVFESGEADFAFGDQEEMGLGMRLATPLIVKRGGTITNSDGKLNEAGAWGQPALWCDYSGVIDGHRVGMLLMPSPQNFRESWFHVRDYGLMVANPFGRHAMTGGETSSVVVKRGEAFRLAFAVLVYERPDEKPVAAREVFEWYAGREKADENGGR